MADTATFFRRVRIFTSQSNPGLRIKAPKGSSTRNYAVYIGKVRAMPPSAAATGQLEDIFSDFFS